MQVKTRTITNIYLIRAALTFQKLSTFSYFQSHKNRLGKMMAACRAEPITFDRIMPQRSYRHAESFRISNMCIVAVTPSIQKLLRSEVNSGILTRILCFNSRFANFFIISSFCLIGIFKCRQVSYLLTAIGWAEASLPSVDKIVILTCDATMVVGISMMLLNGIPDSRIRLKLSQFVPAEIRTLVTIRLLC